VLYITWINLIFVKIKSHTEPLMSFEGFQVIENTDKSGDLLNSYFEQVGFKIVGPGKDPGPARSICRPGRPG
jgi:hypothetical protein